MINGVRKRKVDWHNYKQIAEDEQRRGIASIFSIYLILLLNHK